MYVTSHRKLILKTLKQITANDLISNGKRTIPSKFYVHTYHSEDVEEHLIESGYPFYEKWSEWLNDGRIFVEKERPKGKEYAI